MYITRLYKMLFSLWICTTLFFFVFFSLSWFMHCFVHFCYIPIYSIAFVLLIIIWIWFSFSLIVLSLFVSCTPICIRSFTQRYQFMRKYNYYFLFSFHISITSNSGRRKDGGHRGHTGPQRYSKYKRQYWSF